MSVDEQTKMAKMAKMAKMPASSRPEVLTSFLLLLALVEVPGVRCLSFKHCAGHYYQKDSLTCIRQGIRTLEQAVGDLPTYTRVLNISDNRIRLLPARGLENLTALQHLRLEHNQLMSIEPHAFWRLDALRELNLSHNQLVYLQPGAFESLPNLTDLVLRGNRLAIISGEVVRPLVRLANLDISHNCFRNVSAVMAALGLAPALRSLNLQGSCVASFEVTSRFPPLLSLLVLANNSISGLSGEAAFFRNIRRLDLSNCGLTRAGILTSIDFSSLGHLDIGGNPMERSQVIEVVRDIRAPLVNITLSNLELETKETLHLVRGVLRDRKVHSVILQHNRFQDVSGVFNQSDSILYVDLSHNKIKKANLFTCVGSPSSVQVLVLDHNNIRDVSLCGDGPNGSRRGRCLENLRQLSFRYNRISAIESHAFQQAPNLERLSLALNEINFINTTAFVGLTKLKFLSVTNNCIGEIFNTTFSHVRTLEHLKMRNNRIPIVYRATYSTLTRLVTLDLGGNHIEMIHARGFSGLHSLVRLYLDKNWLSSISAGMFEELQSLQVLDLANNKLSFKVPPGSAPPFTQLPKLRMLKLPSQVSVGPMTLHHDLFQGLRQLKTLDISDNKFTTLNTLPFHPLVQLQFLQLSNIYHGFQTMHNATFAGLVNLRVLMLENVGLESIRGVLFENLSSLRTLVLKSNMVHVIREGDIPRLPNLVNLDLQENPISCVCDNLWFQRWAESSQVQVPWFYQYPCVDPRENGTRLLAQFDSLICDNGYVVFCSTAPALLVFLLGTLAYHKGKWNIHYGYYLFRAWIREKELSRSHTRGHRYDAFVSYNSKDEDWVLDRLIQHLELEGPPFHRLCFHHRDFAVGKPIVENIVDAIYNSKKTLCIISKNYLQSEWCSMEMQVALYRLFDEHSDVLILVFLEEIPAHVLSSYHHLRKLVRGKTYINWPTDDAGQKLFWAKLRDALQAHGPPAGEQDHPLIRHASLLR